MDNYVRNFVLVSLLYLAVGLVGGALSTANMGWRGESVPLPLVSVQAHIMTIGWASFMLFGLSYHFIPRILGKPLHSSTMAHLHFWLMNFGIWMYAIAQPLAPTYGLVVAYQPGTAPSRILGLSGLLELLAGGLFVYNLSMTVAKSRRGP